MAEKVQIDKKLFLELVRYHCLDLHDDQQKNEYIKHELEAKLNKMVARQQYKDALFSNDQTAP